MTRTTNRLFRLLLLPIIAALLFAVSPAPAYVEAPYSLGQMIKESTTIVLMEVTKVNKEKNLIIYKKLADLKGKHPKDEIKHNIGKGGFHPRVWQIPMAWAEEGKKAVFFHNGGASETCIGDYWYQCYPQGEWWGMSHAEPFLARSFSGSPDKLRALVIDMLAGKEVVVPCAQFDPAKTFKSGKNVLAVLVKNKSGSSDLYLDLEVSAQVPLPKKPKQPAPPK